MFLLIHLVDLKVGNPSFQGNPHTNQRAPAPIMNTAPVATSPKTDPRLLSHQHQKPEIKPQSSEMNILDNLNHLINENLNNTNNTRKEENPKVSSDSKKDKADIYSNAIWSGFITKSKKNRVGVDAILVKGDDNILKDTEYNLNISHRTTYDEVFKKP